MSISNRTRSEGWRHAKLDGHLNEQQFAEDILLDREVISTLEKEILKRSLKGEPSITVDGTKHVKSIFGDLTTSKVDLSLQWDSGERINISLKKSLSGQVWLISVPRFLDAIEFHLGEKLKSEIKIGISLFIGGSNLINYQDYFEKAIALDRRKYPKLAELETHQSRLVASTISENFPSIWESTLSFFDEQLGLITKLAFAQGLAISDADSADAIIYNQKKDGPSIFPIKKVVSDSIAFGRQNPICTGPKNGGTTLMFPTGFLQMHHPQGENQLQFHHQYKKISKL